MKRVLLILLVAMFASCSSDDDMVATPPAAPPTTVGSGVCECERVVTTTAIATGYITTVTEVYTWAACSKDGFALVTEVPGYVQAELWTCGPQ